MLSVPFDSLFRYYEYLFGYSKWQNRDVNHHSQPELSSLQVIITSEDSECDKYPGIASDEACEYLIPCCVTDMKGTSSLSHFLCSLFTGSICSVVV